MDRFLMGQRVVVREDALGTALNAVGTVKRVRTDDGAWVALDERSRVESVHPFPADDPRRRGTHVLAYPDKCELACTNSAERRAAGRRRAG